METFLFIFINNTLPVFLLIGVGFILGRAFSLDIATLTKITFYAVIPALVFVSMTNTDIPSDIGFIILFSLAYLLSQYLVARIASLSVGMSQAKTSVLANSLMFFNSGNMGLPLIILAFSGTPYFGAAVTIQIAVMVIQTIFSQTLGFYIAEKGKKTNTWKRSFLVVLRMPTIYAVIAALLFKGVNVDVTSVFLWTSLEYLEQMLIGISLLTLGIHLAKTDLHIQMRSVFFPTILRLIAGPAIAFLLSMVFGFDSFTTSVLVLSSAMPTAVNIALISIESDTSPEYSSQIVVATTLMSIITIPFIITLIM
jgi:predicted permease